MDYSAAPMMGATTFVTYAHAALWMADARHVKADPAIKRRKKQLVAARIRMARFMHRAARWRLNNVTPKPPHPFGIRP